MSAWTARILPVTGGALLAGLAAGCVAAPPSGPRAVTLVRDGRPEAAILLAGAPTRSARFAALELQHHVRRMTGAVLPIVREGEPVPGASILVGDSAPARARGFDPAGLAFEEYEVRAGAGWVLLAGRDAADTGEVLYDPDDLSTGSGWPGFWDERGTLHAVYHFLEQSCGVRWLTPTEWGTVLPRGETLTVSVRAVRRAPAFRYRDAIGAMGDAVRRYDEYTALWRADEAPFQAWERAAYPALYGRYTGAAAEQARAAAARLFLLRRRNGGEICRCNHSLYGYYDRFWRGADRRPEFFAQGYEGEPPQLCYSNPALIRQVAQDARDYYDGVKTGAELGIFWRPSPPNPFPIEPMDNGSFCRCPACRAQLDSNPAGAGPQFSTGTHSDYFFRFVDAVARELARTHPQAPLVTLAYMTHAAPPRSFRLHPGVMVQFCFTANRSPFSPQYAHELALLDQWAAESRGRRPLYLWLYDTFPLETARNGRYHCFPGFFSHRLADQMRRFRRLGVRGMFHCGFAQDLDAYLTLQMMDDPDQDVDALIDEYCRGLYGRAAAPMKALYAALEETYCDPALRPSHAMSGPELNWGILGNAERMDRFQALLDQACAAAVDEHERAGVDLFERSVWSYMKAGREQFLARSRAPVPALDVPRITVPGDWPSPEQWEQAAPLGGTWFRRGGDQPAARRLSGRVLHDGRRLFLELTDPCDTARLQASAMVFPCDDWEVFAAAQRAPPYRQYAVGPTGLLQCLSHGEVNFRQNVPLENPGVRAASSTSDPARWVTRLAFPLAGIVPGGALPGGSLFLNVIRVSSSGIGGEPGLGIDTWVPYCTVHEVDRLAELRLAP